jgi:hypothetical protein
VAEIGLDGASVVAVVGELEPAGVAEHVCMDREAEAKLIQIKVPIGAL